LLPSSEPLKHPGVVVTIRLASKIYSREGGKEGVWGVRGGFEWLWHGIGKEYRGNVLSCCEWKVALS